MRNRRTRITRSSIAAGIFLLVTPGAADGGIGINGFFDEYLALGPYSHPGGDSAGTTRQAADFLCDGHTSEDSIVPAEGLVLGHPQNGGCADQYSSGYVGSGEPTIIAAATSGDLLDLRQLYTESFRVAYAWVYVENLTGAPLTLTLALASDDGVQVKVNTLEAFNISAPLYYDVPGYIHDRFPITLSPGMNLVQFKVFQGAAHWGLRARLENLGTSSPIRDGDERVRVGIVGGSGSFAAVREIVANGGARTADISIAIGNEGAVYTLEENFGPAWSVVSSSEGAIVSGRTIAWRDTTAAELRYRLVRTRAFTREEGAVGGSISTAEFSRPVLGARQILGFSPGYVGDVLLSPPFAMIGINGCAMEEGVLEGPWIGDGKKLTDESIVPREGLEFRPDFGGPGSQAAGLARMEREGDFWSAPGDPAASKARLVRFFSNDRGVFNFTAIYGSGINDGVNAAYFFVQNDTGMDPFPVVLGLGSDDSVAVRVNGPAVWSKSACRPVQPFEDKVPLTLRPGKNLIAVYTFNGGGEYGLALRFEDEAGTPMALETSVDPEGYQGPPPPPDCTGEIAQTGKRWAGVFLDTRVPLRGGELGLAYDPAQVTLHAVRAGASLPLGATLQVQRRPGNQCAPETGITAGLTMAWILPASAPYLPEGRHEVLQMLFTPAGNTPVGACTPLRFVTCLGVAGAPVENVVTDTDANSIPVVTRDGQLCLLEETSLRRGDANGDGRFDISDPIGVLSCLFLGDSCGTCPDSGDVDDNGIREITDAIRLLNWRFLDGQPPADPFPACGLDSTLDELGDCDGASCP